MYTRKGKSPSRRGHQVYWELAARVKTLTDSSMLGTHSDLPSFSSYTSQTKATTTMSARSKATDRPRSRRRGHSSTRVPQYSADRIKETNPRRVDRLWRQVMAPKVSKKLPSNAPPRSRATRSSGLGEEVQSNWSTLPLQDAATNEIQASPSVTQVSTTCTSKSESDKNCHGPRCRL